MAILNYYRYSSNPEIKRTNIYNLIIDIVTYAIFIIILLLQDIIFLIPANKEIISMKVRRYFLSVLLILEFIIVVGMRIIITNHYIPMAFILIAYANFNVYPDPRYNWDDEEVVRKTIFDIFNPEIDLRSDISYNHYVKTKGIKAKKSRKTFSFINRKGSKNLKNKVSNESTKRNIIQKSSVMDRNSTNLNINYYNNLYRNSNMYREEKLKVNKKSKTKNQFYKLIKCIRKEMKYKRKTRSRHNSEIILLVIFLGVFISFGISIMFPKSKKNIYTFKDMEEDIENAKQKPAICQWRADGISINEFCVLSYAAYYRNLDDVTHSWSFGRPESSTNNFTIGDNNINSKTGVHYVDFINEEKNILVVAIRGTLTMEDMFQDCYIWSASALLQVSGFFGTFVSFWPRDTIALLVNLIVKQFTNLQLLYWKDVEKHVLDLQLNTNYTLYLTGHSLGGGVAAVISAHLNVPAITFSSPGLGYSYKTYDIEIKRLIRNLVNIIPMSDPIPLLDSQVGQIQYIKCKTGQPLACHRVMNTLDTLNALCDEKSIFRYWDKTAEKYINGEYVDYELHP